MYNRKSIESMNFDDLRSFVKVLYAEVQEISGLLARTKRQYDDMLYNLSKENMSVEFINEQESMFEQTENGIKSVIAKNITGLRQFSEEELKSADEVSSIDEMTDTARLYKIPIPDKPGLFTYYCYYAPLDLWVPINDVEQQKFSTIEQTDNKIFTSVSAAMTSVDTKLNQYSTTKQTAEMIESKVKEEIGNADGGVDLTNYTTKTQTAEAISQTAYRGFSEEVLENATEVSSEEFMKEPNVLYYIKNGDSRTYYAYNSILNRYMPLIDGQSIYTVFKQTTDGFEFKGNVLIDASLIAKGMLKGIVFADISETGYLNLVSHTVDGVAFPAMVYEDKNGNELFKVLFDGAGTTDIYLNGTKFGYIGNGGIFRPVGTWNFTNTSVEGLGVVPVFG